MFTTSEIKKMFKEKAKTIEQRQYKETATICNALGSEFLKQEKYDDALQQHLEELEYCELTDDQLGIAVANRRIGECYTMLSNFKKALIHIRKFYDIAISLKSIVEEQRAWATFGRTYYLKYQHECGQNRSKSHSKTLDRAELAYYKALNLLKQIVSHIKPIELAEMKCRLLLNLGLVCETRGDHKLSSKYVKEGFDIASQNGLYEDIHRCGYALGTLYQKVGKHVEADEILNKALMAAKKLHNNNLIGEVLLPKAISLISLEKYDEAKKCLKSAYKIHTANTEDFEKIAKSLKVCIGIDNYEKKLKTCKNVSQRKIMLEKIADGLSSIGCYKLAIEKYHLTLECMEDDASPASTAPIYYSLAQTYLDDGATTKALEFLQKEYDCHKNEPLEQIETAWKMAEILEGEKKIDKSEELYLKAVSLAEKAKNQKFIHSSLTKLLSFYNSIKKNNLVEGVRKKLENIKYECLSEEETENEDSQEVFNDIHLSELSDSDNNEEDIITLRKRNKKFETKVNEKGETPLHQACINGNLNMVKRLVENGHSVNVRDFAGWTPLHEACNYGFYDIVEFLLENGARINDPGGPACKGITALHDASSCGNFDVIQLLISKGASVTVVDENGETPLNALLQWKKRSIGELDDATLKQCKAVEEELKAKMVEGGLSIEKFLDSINMADSSDIRIENHKVGEKRSRSPSLSSSDSDVDNSPPYFNTNITEDWDDANEATTAYKTAMENLRRSAADIKLPLKSKAPRINGPSLLNENEIVNDWLIKDTNEIPKTKRKRRRFNKLNVRTSKRIDNYLINQDSTEEKESRGDIFNSEDSNISVPSVDPIVEKHPEQPLKNESSKVAFCLRVNIDGKLILVPITEVNSTIGWLKEAASSRFQSIEGNKPYLSLTKNGALLSDADFVKDIFSNNEEVLSSVERWDEQSITNKYIQICTKYKVIVSSSIKQQFHCLETSYELNFSNCNIPCSQKNIIFCTLLNYKTLQHLNFSGTALSKSNLRDLVSCIPSFSALVTLNLSCCSLTSESVAQISDYLDNHMSRTPVFQSLKILNLSYNIFSSYSCLITFFKLNSLKSIHLSSCGLDSTFLSHEMLEMIKEKYNIEELDISGNIFGSNEISEFLHHLPTKCLTRLNFRHIVEKPVSLGYKLRPFLNEILSNLTELILQGCHLIDRDLDNIAECLSCCPQLQSCDISANPSISSCCIYKFINKAYENNLNITELNLTGTCEWKDDVYNPADFLKFKKLNHLCFDNCDDNIVKNIIQFWSEKWGSRAIYSNILCFWELNVK